MDQRIIGWVALCGLCVLGCNGRSTTTTVGTESHFLVNCQTDGVCGADLSCRGGRCTKVCEADDDCAALSAASSCIDDGDGAGSLCDIRCDSERDCNSLPSASCTAGACRVDADAAPGGSVTGTSTGTDAGGNVGGNVGGNAAGRANGGRSEGGDVGLGLGGTVAALSCECGPRPTLPVRACEDGSPGSTSCVQFSDGTCGWQQDECPTAGDRGGAGGTGESDDGIGGAPASCDDCGPPPSPFPTVTCDDGVVLPPAMCVESEGEACLWSPFTCGNPGGAGGVGGAGGAGPGGADPGGAGGVAAGGSAPEVAVQALDGCDVETTGEFVVQEIVLPAELDDPSWSPRADACDQADWDLSLCAGSTATFTAFATGQADPDPTTIWVVTLEDDVCCVYGGGDDQSVTYDVACN